MSYYLKTINCEKLASNKLYPKPHGYKPEAWASLECSHSPCQINPWSLDSASLRKRNSAFSGNNYYFSQISNYNGRENLTVMLFHLEKHFSFIWPAWRKQLLWNLQSFLIRDWIEIWFYHLVTLGKVPDFCIILESSVILFSENHPTHIAERWQGVPVTESLRWHSILEHTSIFQTVAIWFFLKSKERKQEFLPKTDPAKSWLQSQPSTSANLLQNELNLEWK